MNKRDKNAEPAIIISLGCEEKKPAALKEWPLKVVRDSQPLYSDSHPQWLIPRGAHAEPGDMVKKLWKRYYRPIKASDHEGLVIAGAVNESGWVLEVSLPISKNWVASLG